MRIAIDCRPIVSPGKGEMAGIGHYVRFLVRHLLKLDEENSYVLFFDERTEKDDINRLIGGHRNAERKILPLSRFKRLFPYAYSHRYVASAIARSGASSRRRASSAVSNRPAAFKRGPSWKPTS